jgi:hypothetical protein
MYKQYNQNISIKIIKYLIIGLIINLSLKYLPDNNINTYDIIIISCIASISYAVMDMLSPSIKINSI